MASPRELGATVVLVSLRSLPARLSEMPSEDADLAVARQVLDLRCVTTGKHAPHRHVCFLYAMIPVASYPRNTQQVLCVMQFLNRLAGAG